MRDMWKVALAVLSVAGLMATMVVVLLVHIMSVAGRLLRQQRLGRGELCKRENTPSCSTAEKWRLKPAPKERHRQRRWSRLRSSCTHQKGALCKIGGSRRRCPPLLDTRGHYSQRGGVFTILPPPR
jgi:hypothetical protein